MCSLYVYNKIDSVSIDFLDKLAREPNTAVMSCELDLGVQDVVDRIWQELRLIRIYTKRYALSYSTCLLSCLRLYTNVSNTERAKNPISMRR